MAPFYKPTSERILSRDAVRELDQTAIVRLGIPGLVLMENAARAVTQWILTELENSACENRAKWSNVLIFCGIGNNAGDGLAVARHLQLHGINFQIFLCANPERFRGDAQFQYELAQKLDLPMTELYAETEKEGVFRAISESLSEIDSSFYLVDALLGTGAVGAPRFPMNAVISWMNMQATRGSRLLAIDVPTGLDCETGAPFDGEENVARADVTLTLAAAKPGLITENARKFVGDLWISDIGVSVEKIREA